jgi:hypothetical protein
LELASLMSDKTYSLPVRIFVDKRPYIFKVEVNETKMTAEVTTAIEPVDAQVRGLGDVVSKAAKSVGIEKKKGCGCARRQKILNDMVPLKPESKTVKGFEKVLGLFGKSK